MPQAGQLAGQVEQDIRPDFKGIPIDMGIVAVQVVVEGAGNQDDSPARRRAGRHGKAARKRVPSTSMESFVSIVFMRRSSWQEALVDGSAPSIIP